MGDIIVIILPLVLLLAIGFLSVRLKLLMRSDWQSVEKFSFIILYPAFIIHAIYRSDLSLQQSGPYIGALYLVISAAGLATLALRLIIDKSTLAAPTHSTMFQTVTRWNAFVILPIVAAIFGDPGLSIIAIAMAFMIPFINVVNITVISILHAKDFNLAAVLINILKNPLIIACIIGLAINIAGITPPKPITQTLDLVARGALAIGLMCIGASFDWQRLLTLNWNILWGVTVKNIAAPAAFYALATLFGLGSMETLCGMLVVAAPTAANGFVIARQMGGNADLYAYTMTWQLMVSVISIPVMIYLVA